MSLLSENIRHLRKSNNMTQQDLAGKAEITRSAVGAYEEGRAEPSVSTLLKFSRIFDTPVDEMIGRDLVKGKKYKALPEDKLKVLSITVDKEDNENIELVPQRAAAGYLNGYADPEYIKELPKFQLPTLPRNATYRAFEISGDSMLPIQPGSIIVGEYVESINDIKDDNTYVLVTRKEGIVYKRVNKTETRRKLLLVSDNDQYAPYEMDTDDVLEIWKARAFVSDKFPIPQNEDRMTIGKLTKIVMELQKEVIKLSEE